MNEIERAERTISIGLGENDLGQERKGKQRNHTHGSRAFCLPRDSSSCQAPSWPLSTIVDPRESPPGPSSAW